MRLNQKLPGAALFAAAALFAVVVASPTANAFSFRGIDAATPAHAGPETVQTVAITRNEARQARRDIRQALRADCRNGSTRADRRECRREARSDFRNLRDEARANYRACRQDGGSRYDCRQERRAYWLGVAEGDGGGTDVPGGDGGVGDRGED